MPELSPRLPCPVCLGTVLEKIALGAGGRLVVDRCHRCGGLWLEHGEVQQLRARKPDELWQKLERRDFPFHVRCHDCHASMGRSDERCPSCGWTNVLDCPACEQPMQITAHVGLRLDVCRACKGAWFDHHELEAIWGAGFDEALQRRNLSRHDTLAKTGYGAGDVLFDTLFFAPDLVYYAGHAAGHAVSASAEALAHAPEAIGAAPEAAGAVVEAVGEAAGSVFETIAEIIGGLFGGL